MSYNFAKIRRIVWLAMLMVGVVVVFAMSFHVNAIKSEVRLKERQIVALEHKKTLLETEFQTRANQQQLSDWNAVEFGYQAPEASQYLENDRQLAALGSPAGPGEPEPIRVAHADGVQQGQFPAMVSPLTGKPIQGRVSAAKAAGDGASASAEPSVSSSSAKGEGDE